MEPRIPYAGTSDGVNIGYWTMGEGMPLVFPGYPVAPAQILTEDRKWYERLALSLQAVIDNHTYEAVKKILLADDEPTLVLALTYNLEKAGYGVVTARDGEATLAAARETLPDLIILRRHDA